MNSAPASSLHTAIRRRRAPRGFTLIEVLTAMMVLAVGLAGAIALIYGSQKAGVMAGDQNIAASLMQEALEDIQRNHVITKGMTVGGVPVPATDVGLFIETLPTGDGSWPHIGPAGDAGFYQAATTNLFYFRDYRNSLWPNELFWPTSPSPRYYGGPLGGNLLPTGSAFRVLYKIERHPNWLANQLSFERIYVLTMTVYKDLNPTVPPKDPKKKVEQISDPMVVYLRARVNQ